eukprot:986053_1
MSATSPYQFDVVNEMEERELDCKDEPHCVVNCNARQACREASITCGQEGGLCEIQCTDSACQHATITCVAGDCTVTGSEMSLLGAHIHTENANSLSVNANGWGSLYRTKIFCPIHEDKECNLDIIESDNLDITMVNTDIDIGTNGSLTITCRNTDNVAQQITERCESNSKVCVAGEWFPICPDSTTFPGATATVCASPRTPAPITGSPTTASPTTASPTTASPTTDSPTKTASPTTASPTTASPTTDSPTKTASPVTETKKETDFPVKKPATGTPTTDSQTKKKTDFPVKKPATGAPTTDSQTKKKTDFLLKKESAAFPVSSTWNVVTVVIAAVVYT